MCGRYASSRSTVDLSALFGAVDETDGVLRADYNVAPTDPVPIVRLTERLAGVDDGPASVLSVARWGLVPPWSKDVSGAARMINARAETVATSRAFAPSFQRRRCLVPADGWYEWVRREGGGKQPYFMTRSDGGPLAFAGIWSVWGDGPDRLLTTSVITTAAVADLARVHDRMPLLLPPDRWDTWLSAAGSVSLLEPPPVDFLSDLEIRPVAGAVGDVRNDGPSLVQRVVDSAHGASLPSTVDYVSQPLF